MDSCTPGTAATAARACSVIQPASGQRCSSNPCDPLWSTTTWSFLPRCHAGQIHGHATYPPPLMLWSIWLGIGIGSEVCWCW